MLGFQKVKNEQLQTNDSYKQYGHMSKTFLPVIEKYFPNAENIIGKFHLIRC
jgi:hypothetical protein